jgi:predicted dehydrogenase
MERELRVGIAGYGIVGKRRRLFVDQHPHLQTVAICDRLIEQSGSLVDGARAYSNYTALLAQEKLDVLFVCLTNEVVAEVTIAGLEQGLHVFCEKPPGRDLQDISNVILAERRHPGLKLKYGFNHRYHDSVRDALRIVEKQELGNLINLRGVYGKSKMINFDSDWRTQRAVAGGGILLDQGIHMVDMMRLFAGEFTQLHSFVSNGYWKHDVEDNAYALMRTQSGVVAMLHSSATQWRHRFQLELSLERGSVLLAGILSGTKSYGDETITIAYVGQNDQGAPKEQTTRYTEDNSWRDEIFEFADSVVRDTPIVNGSSYQALKTMELVYRIYCADPEWRQAYQLNDKIPDEVRKSYE